MTMKCAEPPRSRTRVIEARDPAWQCRQFGMGRIGVVACTRR
jgi:hypothetical protein